MSICPTLVMFTPVLVLLNLFVFQLEASIDMIRKWLRMGEMFFVL